MKQNTRPFGVGFRVKGRYANYFKVGHNACEFVIDFGQIYPEGGDNAEFHTRIITNPLHAKAFLETLLHSMDQYQSSFGTIVEDEGGKGA
jgi:hypothetical protein